MRNHKQQTSFRTHPGVACQFIVVIAQNLRKCHNNDLEFSCASLFASPRRQNELISRCASIPNYQAPPDTLCSKEVREVEAESQCGMQTASRTSSETSS